MGKKLTSALKPSSPGTSGIALLITKKYTDVKIIRVHSCWDAILLLKSLMGAMTHRGDGDQCDPETKTFLQYLRCCLMRSSHMCSQTLGTRAHFWRVKYDCVCALK